MGEEKNKRSLRKNRENKNKESLDLFFLFKKCVWGNEFNFVFYFITEKWKTNIKLNYCTQKTKKNLMLKNPKTKLPQQNFVFLAKHTKLSSAV